MPSKIGTTVSEKTLAKIVQAKYAIYKFITGTTFHLHAADSEDVYSHVLCGRKGYKEIGTPVRNDRICVRCLQRYLSKQRSLI